MSTLIDPVFNNCTSFSIPEENWNNIISTSSNENDCNELIVKFEEYMLLFLVTSYIITLLGTMFTIDVTLHGLYSNFRINHPTQLRKDWKSPIRL